MIRKKSLQISRIAVLLTSVLLLLVLSSCSLQGPDTPPALFPQAPWEGGQWADSQNGFTAEQEGWFIGSSGVAMGHQENYVFLTHDAGKTWTQTGNVNDVWPRVVTCGAFANDKVGFLCFRYDIENFGRIYRTLDGGETWTQFDLDLSWSLPANAELCGEARAIGFDGSTGNGAMELFTKLAGSDPDSGSIMTLVTPDFGETWEFVSTRPAKPLAALGDLPADYSSEDALEDGVYVTVHGKDVYNQGAIDSFYIHVFAGMPAFMRTMEYTVEGDPIMTDYQFDGEKFTVTTDTTRDRFAGEGDREITTSTYKYLVPLDRSRPQGVTLRYYLSNEQSIFTGTGDGGATLIEGLGMIPSPSEGVQR